MRVRRKCRLAFESIAGRYPRESSQHVFDVGRKRRIGVDVVLDLSSGDAKPHGEPHYIDELLAGMPDEMCPENTVAGLIHNDLRPGDGLGISSRRKPIVHVIAMNLDANTSLV